MLNDKFYFYLQKSLGQLYRDSGIESEWSHIVHRCKGQQIYGKRPHKTLDSSLPPSFIVPCVTSAPIATHLAVMINMWIKRVWSYIIYVLRKRRKKFRGRLTIVPQVRSLYFYARNCSHGRQGEYHPRCMRTEVFQMHVCV